jgi:hypothetical protein
MNEEPKKPVSRQRLWQLKHRALGLCTKCSRPLVTKNYCLKHAVQEREYHRQRSGAIVFARRNTGCLTYRLEQEAKEKENG